MGILIHRYTFSSTLPGSEAKKKMIAFVDRFSTILQTTSKRTFLEELDGSIKIKYTSKSGAPLEAETKRIDDKLFRDLMNARTCEFLMKTKGNVGGFEFKIVHDDEKHGLAGFEMDAQVRYKEGVDKKLMGVVLIVDLLASQWLFDRYLVKMNAFRKMIKKLAKAIYGDTLISSFRQIDLKKYERDKIYINLMGFHFTITRGL